MKASFRILLGFLVVFPQILVAQIRTHLFTEQPGNSGPQAFAGISPPDSSSGVLAVQAPSVRNDAAFSCKSTAPVPTTKPYFAACINALDGSLIQSCQLQVLLNVLQGSGGHFHTDPGRDPGTLIAPDGTRSGTGFMANTGTAGFFQFQLESPDTAGQDIVTLLGTSPIGPVSPSIAEIDVEAPDPRVPLPAAGFKFQVDENSTGHTGADQWANQNGSLEFQLLPVNWAILETGAGDSLDQIPCRLEASLMLKRFPEPASRTRGTHLIAAIAMATKLIFASTHWIVISELILPKLFPTRASASWRFQETIVFDRQIV